MSSPVCLWLRRCWHRLARLVGIIALLALCASAAQAAASPPLLLSEASDRIELWPSLRVLEGASPQASAADVLARLNDFRPPPGAYQALHQSGESRWLHMPFVTAPEGDIHRVLDLGSPTVSRADVYLFKDGAPILRTALGVRVPAHERPMLTRTHSVELLLKPGARYDLLIRMEPEATAILPITLSRLPAFVFSSLRAQLFLGLVFGLGLTLLVYSLGQWATLREVLYAKYALLISGSLLFCLAMYGTGALYFWSGWPWFGVHAAGLGACMATAGSFLFIEQALGERDVPRWLSRVMKAGAVLMAVIGALYLSELMNPRLLTALISVLGLTPAALGVVGALRKARRGDPVGHYFLIGWAIYLIATGIMIRVIKGQMDANVWSIHAYLLGATLDMLIFIQILGLRAREIKLAAESVSRERDSLHSLAHTDALTGLPNRRAVNQAVSAMLAARKGNELVALFMLDLDGFKAVNDKSGHSVGDALLVEVAARLKSQLRPADLLSRLGGDEFVVLTQGLKTANDAQHIADALCRSINQPFAVHGRRCRVSLTVGYALAPIDGTDADTLMRQADAALYAGKNAGKSRAVRLAT